MGNIFLYSVEWIGAITALFGSYCMATIKDVNNSSNVTFFEKNRPTFAYIGWILSNFFCIYLFLVKSSYGMLAMNIGGLLVNIIGIYQWKSTHNSQILSKILFYISAFMALISISFLVAFTLNNTVENIEWFGSTLGLVAAFLLASKTDKSYICWFIWCISNLTLLVLTLYLGLYGMAFLQFGFMVINIIGCIRWVKMLRNNSFNTLTHAEISNE